MTGGALHDLDLPRGQWWACVHPERPDEQGCTWYEERCRACVVALGAAAMYRCDAEEMIDEQGNPVGSFRWSYEKYRHAHGLPPLPVRSDR